MNETIFLGLGSNIGHRIEYLEAAFEALQDRVGVVLSQSSYYKTDAWGNETQDFFVNQVLQLQTSLTANQVLEQCQAIEKSLGRVKNETWGPRCIDIDILIYGKAHIQEPQLQVPHPHLQYRNFVLLPLCEIAKDWMHPVLKQSFARLLEQCIDHLGVHKLVSKDTLNLNYGNS